MAVRIIVGDALTRLGELPDQSVHCVITSPPYWGLRSYQGGEGMIGLEPTWDEHLDNLLAVFREVRRVLRDDGVCVVNYGDAYCSTQNGRAAADIEGDDRTFRDKPVDTTKEGMWKPKDLMMMPSRVAIAMQEDGWFLRSMIPWIKKNPMPESVTDRPTSAVEYFFLFSKRPRYFWDSVAVRTPVKECTKKRLAQKTFDTQQGGPKDSKEGNRSHRKVLENLKKRQPAGWATSDNYKGQDPRYADRRGQEREDKQRGHGRRHDGFNDRWDAMPEEEQQAGGANMRNYIFEATKPFSGAHFATFPPAVIEPFIRAGCPVGGTVLDPFGGAGTVGLVADRHQRDAILIEISPEYAEMARQRIDDDAPLLAVI